MTWQEDCSRKRLMSMVNWPQVNSGTGNSGVSFQTLILVCLFHKDSGNASHICTALEPCSGEDQTTSGFSLGAQSCVVHGYSLDLSFQEFIYKIRYAISQAPPPRSWDDRTGLGAGEDKGQND